MECGGDHRRVPGEYDGRAGEVFPGAADEAGAADHDEQVVAENRGRQSQRQGGQGVKQILAGELFVGEQPGEPDSEDQRNSRGAGRDLETQPEGEPVDRHDGGFSLCHAEERSHKQITGDQVAGVTGTTGGVTGSSS